MKYKVGDKVRIKSIDWYNENKDDYGYVWCTEFLFTPEHSKYCGRELTISHITEIPSYVMESNGHDWTAEMIEGLVEEEEIEFTEEDKYWCDIMSESDPTTYVLPEGYIFKDENGNVINATKIVLEKKKKEYPKLFVDCCAILYPNDNFQIVSQRVKGHKGDLLFHFQKLLICRDAYWQIAGAEMGLGKSWEPDWKNSEERRYSIVNIEGDINLPEKTLTKWILKVTNKILVFPTEEMRDAFYENFKEEIEKCKELL